MLAGVGLLTLLLGMMSARQLTASAEGGIETELTAIARSFSDDFEGSDSRQLMARGVARLARLNPDLRRASLYAIDRSGRVEPVASTGGDRDALAPPYVQPIRAGRAQYTPQTDDDPKRATLSYPVSDARGKVVGALVLVKDSGAYDRTLAHNLRSLVVTQMAGAGLLALLLVLVIERTVVRPIRSLRTATRDLTERKRGVRLGWKRSDELGQLADDFDEMASALDERDDLEVRLQQSQRVESLGQLAGGIAHDFNNSLAVILNYAAFVSSQLPEGDPAREDVEEIRAAAEHAATLTHQLLVFSRREALKPEVIDLGVIATRAEKLLARTMGDQVAVRTSIGPSTWPVEADPGQLEHLLVNLAVNARDAMPDGGTLDMSVENHRVDDPPGRSPASTGGLSPGRYVRLSVSDDGQGMKDDVVARAFEPFFTTKPRGEGTGLGLATVYGTVVRAGGHVELDSEVGRGTRVDVYLPALGETGRSLAAGEGAGTTRPAGATILLVEDEPALLILTDRILSDQGYVVLAARDSEEALRASERHSGRIDMLLTDVVLPGITGKELAERIADSRPGLEVLFMSGYTDDVVLRRGVEHGGMAFIQKPFDADSLSERVRGRLASADRERQPC